MPKTPKIDPVETPDSGKNRQTRSRAEQKARASAYSQYQDEMADIEEIEEQAQIVYDTSMEAVRKRKKDASEALKNAYTEAAKLTTTVTSAGVGLSNGKQGEQKTLLDPPDAPFSPVTHNTTEGDQ